MRKHLSDILHHVQTQCIMQSCSAAKTCLAFGKPAVQPGMPSFKMSCSCCYPGIELSYESAGAPSKVVGPLAQDTLHIPVQEIDLF